MMENIQNVIDSAISVIDDMTELFYQQKKNEALAKMNDVLDNILKVNDTIAQINDISDEDRQRLVVILGEAVKAMESKDYVLLADILKYDMIDILNEYKQSL